jgi:uncharacterized protein
MRVGFLFAAIWSVPLIGLAQALPASPTKAVGAPSRPLDPALEEAARAYREGRFADALSQAESLASRGNGQAAMLAGLIHERGLSGGVAAPEAAVRWYRRAVAAGDVDGMVGLARLGMQRKGGSTPGEAMAVLQRAVAQSGAQGGALGRPDAAAMLADLFVSGAAGPQDRSRAASLYARAASAGDPAAAYAAAILYSDGDPDPTDDPLRAIGLLKQAAESGRADASADYGLMLYQGRGTGRDLVSAARWFKTSAEAGDKDGAFYWALVNARGEGTARDLPNALRWARAAQGSSPDADRLLAQINQALTAQANATIAPSKSDPLPRKPAPLPTKP